MQLVAGELERRASDQLLEKSLAEQARVLESWLRETHPSQPRATKTTIENNIRGAFRRFKGLENKESR